MRIRIIALVLALASLTSCTIFAYELQTGSTTYPETTPNSIKIYSGTVDQEYVVIGSVTADVVGGGGEGAVKHLRKKAAELGADAIIHVDLTKMSSFVQRTGVSGVAIKFK